jgi:hypothetical protein
MNKARQKFLTSLVKRSQSYSSGPTVIKYPTYLNGASLLNLSKKMKAAVRTKYGLPGDLSIKELPIPTPANNEVLIKVYATTVNRSDCHGLSGKLVHSPFYRII